MSKLNPFNSGFVAKRKTEDVNNNFKAISAIEMKEIKVQQVRDFM